MINRLALDSLPQDVSDDMSRRFVLISRYLQGKVVTCVLGGLLHDSAHLSVAMLGLHCMARREDIWGRAAWLRCRNTQRDLVGWG